MTAAMRQDPSWVWEKGLGGESAGDAAEARSSVSSVSTYGHRRLPVCSTMLRGTERGNSAFAVKAACNLQCKSRHRNAPSTWQNVSPDTGGKTLKAKADHDYAKHNFVQAGDLYGQILNRPQISMPIFREACEGRIRCLIKNPTQNQDEAQNLAIQLLQKSNPANQGILLKGIEIRTVRK